MTRTRLYGLTIDSELTFHEQRPPVGPPDVTISVGAPAVDTTEAPAGRRLLHVVTDRPLYTATQVSDGYLLRFYGTCDFEIGGDLSTVQARVVPGADLDLVGVLAAGTMLSFLLSMRGNAVLHASAVQVGESALAFVGRSGMGKSTMATLMCADGARLITDDVLHLDLTTDPPSCHLGATELRLRKAATELSARFQDEPPARVTGDDRDALRMVPALREHLPLRAIVIPAPDHEDAAREPELTRLPAKEALLYLLQFPRVVGWEDAASIDRQFHEVARVVETVPVFVARLPWGPPFADGIGDRVLEATGLGQVRVADSTASR